MSLTKLIDDLAEKSTGLRSAMQSSNVAAIEGALEAFAVSLQKVRSVGQWPAEPELRSKLATLMPDLEQSRALACLLADMTGQMHEMVAGRARDARQPLYARTGERMA